MTDTGSDREPRFSDDHQWWWDGTQWVPAGQAPIPPPPPTQAPVIPPAPSSPVSVPQVGAGATESEAMYGAMGMTAASLYAHSGALPASPKASRFPRWLVIVAAIVFLPITLGILIWRTKWSLRTKLVLTGVLLVVVVAAAIEQPHATSPSPQIASVPSSIPSPVAIATPSPVATPIPSPVLIPSFTPSPVTKPSPVAKPTHDPRAPYIYRLTLPGGTTVLLTSFNPSFFVPIGTLKNIGQLPPNGSDFYCFSPDGSVGVMSDGGSALSIKHAKAFCAAAGWQ